MEIVVPPPSIVLYIAIGLPLMVIAVLLVAARQKPLLPRLIAVGIALVASGIVLSFGYKSMRFAWDETGIHDGTFGTTRDIAWSEIHDVELVPGYWGSQYRPALRTNGSAYANVRSGNFRLANGSTARVFLITDTRDAIVLRVQNEIYVYAPDPFEPFVEAVRAHTGKPAP